MSLNDRTSDKGRSQYKSGLRDPLSIGQQPGKLSCKSTVAKAMQVAAGESVVSEKSYVRIYTLDHTKITGNNAIDGHIGQFDNEIELIDLESLEHKPRMDCSVFLVGPGVPALA